MSANLTPAFPGSPSTAVAPVGAAVPAPYRPAPPAVGGEESGPSLESQIRRSVTALKRFKWVILLLALLGLGGGFLASTLVEPAYQVQSSILLSSAARDARNGPLGEGQVFDAQGWIDLLRTNAIADDVVVKLALYVEPEDADDASLFRNFSLNMQAPRFTPGQYTLEVDGPRWTLRDKVGLVNEQGVVGDSVGRTAGFAWVPRRSALGTDRTVKFRVRQPREASVDALQRLGVRLAEGSNLIFLSMTGSAAQKPAETLNAWNDQFIRIAAEIKNAKVAQSSRALAEQRDQAQRDLQEKRRAYEQFRIQTAGLPSDALAISQGGGVTALRNDPVLDNYVASKVQLETVQRDREQLQRVAGQLAGDQVPVPGLLNVNTVNADPVAAALRGSLTELLALDTEIRVLRRTLQDRTPPLAGKIEQRRTLAAQTIPQQLREVIAQLRSREAQLGGVVSRSTTELRAIPQRTTEGDALRRDLDAAASLFGRLNQSYAESQLAERSMVPDVRVLDRAVMPSQPTERTLPTLLTLGLVGGLGFGLGLALLVDRVDTRFRYPEQVTHGLKLQVLGVVPEVDQSKDQTAEQVAQIVEAFRSLRMNVRYACMPSPRVTLTVTSAGPNEGKSLVASNLALSFAEGGWRTVVVDGDLRRGQLNATFSLPSGPGLVEYLEGASLLGEVIQQTGHENLSLVATGTRHRRGPELLGTPRMHQLIHALAAEFDAVIVDSPPLSAGTDAYAIGTATTNVAFVVRRSATDLRLAESKLQALDTLPVQVIGAVLNQVELGSGLYQYYSYDPDYVLVEGDAGSGASPDPRRLAAAD